MKRREEGGLWQKSPSNATNKRLKLAHDTTSPSFIKLAMQKRTPCKNEDVHNSSSSLGSISVHSQEDLSQSYQSLNYLLKKPRLKVAGPDPDEENLYFRIPVDNFSSSEDDLNIQALPSQSSSPCLQPRKLVLDDFNYEDQNWTAGRKKKTRSKKIKKENKCEKIYSANSLVAYTASASSESSTSNESSSSEEDNSYTKSSRDENLLLRRQLVRATSAENWDVQPMSSSKSKCSSSSTASYNATHFKKPYNGQNFNNDDIITSPISAENFFGYYSQASPSRFNYNNRESCLPKGHQSSEYLKSPEFCNITQRTNYSQASPSPKGYQSSEFLKSPELCNISPRTSYNFQSPYRKSYVPNYDTDEFSSNDNQTFIDSHCHLDFLFRKTKFNGTLSKYRLINEDSFPKSYEGCLAVFCDPQTFATKNSWDYLLEDNNVWGAFGCHPKMSNGYSDSVEQHLLEALQTPKVVALGEIGLDYSTHNFSDIDIQKSVFRKQLKIAMDYQLPLVIHCRDANSDTLEIIKEMVPHNHRIHRHCFTGTWKEAQEWLEPFPNMYIGLTPLVTFPTAREVHETAKNIPLNRLLLETDAPYFMPKILQVSGEKHVSHPGMAIHVAAQVAAMRFMTSLNDVLLATRENTLKMYGI